MQGQGQLKKTQSPNEFTMKDSMREMRDDGEKIQNKKRMSNYQ